VGSIDLALKQDLHRDIGEVVSGLAAMDLRDADL